MNLCEVARQAGVERIVYAASGVSRYGAQACRPVDESNQVGKLAGEMYLRAYAECIVWHRSAWLWPMCMARIRVRMAPRRVIAVLGSAMVTGGPFAVYRDGAAHDYAYVDVDAFAGRRHLLEIPAHITSVQGGTSASPRSTV